MLKKILKNVIQEVLPELIDEIVRQILEQALKTASERLLAKINDSDDREYRQEFLHITFDLADDIRKAMGKKDDR